MVLPLMRAYDARRISDAQRRRSTASCLVCPAQRDDVGAKSRSISIYNEHRAVIGNHDLRSICTVKMATLAWATPLFKPDSLPIMTLDLDPLHTLLNGQTWLEI